MIFDLADLIPLAWIILIITVASAVFVIWSDLKGAPFVTTPRWAIRRMLDMANVNSDDIVYDLGSGDGRLLFVAAEEYGAKAVGIEIDPLRYLWTRWIIRRKGLLNQVEVHRQNIFTADVSEASVVTCYLLSETNIKLMDKLEDELAPGTRIVSRNFKFPGWTLLEEKQGVRKEKIYWYQITK